MTQSKACLLCYKPVEESQEEFHRSCSRKLFSRTRPPPISTTLSEIENLAQNHAKARVAVAGVQPKLSVDLKPSRTFLSTHKGTQAPRISVGIQGQYLLKAPTSQYPNMVELEDLTMHLARTYGINTAQHGLVRLESGELAYITKRFDRKSTRSGITKLAQEDLCQLSGLLTEHKYNSSMEKVGKVIREYSMNPGIDAITFLEIAIFSFVTGNADMHTKNFSLLTTDNGMRGLSPAYDLLATKFLVPQDNEEMALPVNGKKAKLKREDFFALGRNLEIQDKIIEQTLQKFSSPLKSTPAIIERSFISADLKKEYKKLISERMARISEQDSLEF